MSAIDAIGENVLLAQIQAERDDWRNHFEACDKQRIETLDDLIATTTSLDRAKAHVRVLLQSNHVLTLAGEQVLAALDAIIVQAGSDTMPKGWLAAANNMRRALRGPSAGEPT